MTHWVFAAGQVMPLAERPQALILPVLPAADRIARSARRRQVLDVLVRHATGRVDAPLAVDADGRRRVGVLFASVAWRPGWAAAAISRVPVGIDLELVAEAAAAVAAINDGVTVADAAAGHGPAGVWATREAVLKAAGRDLTTDPLRWHLHSGLAFACGMVPHHVDLVNHVGLVVAVAYPGG